MTQYLLNQSNFKEVRMLKMKNPYMRTPIAYPKSVNGTCSPPDLFIERIGMPITQNSTINNNHIKYILTGLLIILINFFIIKSIRALWEIVNYIDKIKNIMYTYKFRI